MYSLFWRFFNFLFKILFVNSFEVGKGFGGRRIIRAGRAYPPRHKIKTNEDLSRFHCEWGVVKRIGAGEIGERMW